MSKIRELITVDIKDLTYGKGNPRKMNARTMGMLCGSIKEHGYLELIVIDENDRIIAGEKRVKAMRKLGITGIIEAIRISGYSETEKKAVALALNRIAGEFDKDRLTEWLLELKQEDYNLYLVGFDDITMEEMDITLPEKLEESNVGDNEKHNQVDGNHTVINDGDLVELDNHRLLCGDSLSMHCILKLMNGIKASMLFTDPPYNINYAEKSLEFRPDTAKDWTGTFCPEGEDNMTSDEYVRFLNTAIANARDNLLEYAHYYVWFATTYYQTMIECFENLGIPYDKIPIIWRKQTMILSWARYKRNYEPCFFAGKGCVTGTSEKARWFGPDNETAVWDIDTEYNGSYIHPTQKPVALAERAIRNSTLPGEIVLDLFAGSGSLLIACQNTGRIAYLMEKSPVYCHRIIDRYCDMVDKAEVRINGTVINWKEYRERVE